MPTETTIYNTRLKFATYGQLPPRHPWRSTSAGAQSSLLDKERKALAKLEKAHAENFDAGVALILSKRYIPESEWSALAKEAADLFVKMNAAAAALEAKANELQAESERLGQERKENARAELLATALPQVAHLLDEMAAGDLEASAARDLNPEARATPRGARRPGGKLVDQLTAHVTEIDQPQVVYLDGPNLALWRKGESCVDLFGNDATGTPSKKVRRAYPQGQGPLGVGGMRDATDY